MANPKRSKNQIRREKAKLRKVGGSAPHDKPSPSPHASIPISGNKDSETPLPSSLVKTTDESSIVETTSDAKLDADSDPLYSQFADIFQKFNAPVLSPNAEGTSKSDEKVFFNDSDLGDDLADVGSDNDDEDDDIHQNIGHDDTDNESDSTTTQPASRRQLRKSNKVPLSALKASTSRPQVVEWHDVDSPDPYLLVQLKAYINTVQVPGHWSFKREYLASRRGIERLPFQLPKFILDTGIQDMRNTADQSNLKSQQRDRVQPKMGKLDIDYQKLHDAFFKFQTKPRVFGFGDVYYEGRESTDEYTDEIMRMKPGKVSKELRKALGMPETDLSMPPPWIAVMAEMGKPPSYEHLVIPGLDSDYNNTGYFVADQSGNGNESVLDQAPWGRPEEGEESEEEDEEDFESGDDEDEEEEPGLGEHEQEDEAEEDQPAKVHISEYSRVARQSTVPKEVDSSSSTTPKQLYTVIKETENQGSSESLLKGDFVYDLGNKATNSHSQMNLSTPPSESERRRETGKKKDFKF